MQAISDAQQAILRSKFQAGADGFRYRVMIGGIDSDPIAEATNGTWATLPLSWAGGTLNAEPTGWKLAGFNDSAWGAAVIPDTSSLTLITGAMSIEPNDPALNPRDNLFWIARHEFVLESNASEDATLDWNLDNWGSIYLDGTLIDDLPQSNWINNNSDIATTTISAASLGRGTHCLAIVVHNDFPGWPYGSDPTMCQARLTAPGTTELPTPVNGVSRISIDKSLQADSDALDVECQLADNDYSVWLPLAVPDARVRVYQWYGDDEDAVQTFEGFIDKTAESRTPEGRTITLTCRDWMKKALVQGAIVSAPQGATEDGAVRTTANFVFLNAEVDTIAASLLTHVDFPTTAVADTSYQVEEFIVPDNRSYAAALSDLASLCGYRSYADEFGGYHFAPPKLNVHYDGSGNPVPDYVFRSGVDVVSLERDSDDYELATRVKVVGPLTSYKDSWIETWSTNRITTPTGLWYDPTDPGNLRVADGTTHRMYTLRQSDRTIVATSAPLTSSFLGGLSGDPGDATIYWTLEIPWKAGGSGGNKIHKMRKSDNAVLATYSIASGRWTDLKADGTNLWLANWDTNKVHKFSLTGTDLAQYSIVVDGVTQLDPSGLALDGTNLYVFFYNTNRMLRVSTAAPTVVLQRISTAGTKLFGGEMDTTTHTDIYASADSLHTTYKYQLAEAVSNEVSVVCIAGVGWVSPEPLVPTGPLETALGEIRRMILQIPVVTSMAQAAATAMAQLALVDANRSLRTVGVVGNPALQKGDLVEIVDPVLSESSTWVLDTYRTEMTGGGTYLGTLGLTPWRA